MADRDYDDEDRDQPQQADIDELGGDDEGEDTAACPFCGRAIYEDADRCPYCGRWVVMGVSRARRAWWTWLLVPAVVVAMVLYLSTC
jgi:predicted nucleic acid-binding Zn ribbon protein